MSEPEAPVLIVVSVDPEISHRASEAVRIALGILAAENRVTLVLLGPGAKVLDPDVEDYVDGDDLVKHLSTLKKLAQRFHVDRTAMSSKPGWNPLGLDVVPIDRMDLAPLIARSRRVLHF